MKNNTRKTLEIYWRHVHDYKASGIAMTLSIIGASVLGVIIPLYYKNFFNVLTGAEPREIIVKTLLFILLIILGLKFVEWLFWRVASFAATYFESSIMADLSNQCFAYLHLHSLGYFISNFVGSLVKRVKYFTSAFEKICDEVIWEFIPLVINVVGITIVLVHLSWSLAIGLIIWIAIFLMINWIFTNYKLRYDIKRTEADTNITSLLADTITNNVNVKLFNGYKREVKSFAEATEDLRRLRKFTWDLGNIFEAVQGFLTVVLEVGIFYVAIKLWQKNILTVGDFVLIQSYVISVVMRVWGFGRIIRKIYENLADAEEMTVILTTPHEIKDVPRAKDLKVKEGKIEFTNVNFDYHRARAILEKFNLIINPGERIALIGPSGGGKTTIVKLLLRMHDLISGQILIDGQDIAKVTQESLWQNISLVPQDPILFHRTLLENIRYGQPKATDEEVVAAAKTARCHEFISELSDGYNTYVGERGIKLSGGERQRVAIARAILHNAPILILDEATSSLDSESENLIQTALNELMINKTVIVIAHRLSTIKKMNRIIVIDKGEIIEEGSHQELSAKENGLYRKLWQLQAGGFI